MGSSYFRPVRGVRFFASLQRVVRRLLSHHWTHPSRRSVTLGHTFYRMENTFSTQSIASNPENSGIYVGSLDSKDTKLILKAHSSALYAPPGYLLFNRAGTLFAQPFDADRLELKGDAIPIAEGVQFNSANGKAAVAVSANGVLAYRLVPTAAQNKLVWVDRKGTEQPLAAPPHAYRNPRLSPDGQRVAVTIDELGTQEWLLDTRRGTLTRLTFEGSYNGALAWTPDGKRVAFGSDRAGPRNLFWQLADGSGGRSG